MDNNQGSNNNRGDRRRRQDQNENLDENDDQQLSQYDEAEEVHSLEEEVENEQFDQEEEGEDLMENMSQDYQERDGLDRYEVGSQDEEQISDIDEEQRREAEGVLRQREKQRIQQQGARKQTNLFKRLLQDLDDSDNDDQARLDQRMQERQRELLEEANNYNDDEEIQEEEEKAEEQKYLDLQECKGKLNQWIQQPNTEVWIKKTFRTFLKTFKEENSDHYFYQDRIKNMIIYNKQSLEIKHEHLQKAVPTLAIWMSFEPSILFPILNQVALSVVLQKQPSYQDIAPEIQVKVEDFIAIDKLRDLRSKDIGNLIKIEGVITRRSQVFSQLKKVSYRCAKCGETKGPIFLNQGEQIKLGSCAVCQSKGPFQVDKSQTIYRNYQKITLQESPGKVPAGRVPRQKDVILLGDNIDSARPGDEVSVTGIYLHRYDYYLNVKHGFPIFQTLIEANNIKRMAELENMNIPKEDEEEILKWSKKPKIAEIIFNSLSSSIHEHYDVKTAICLSMFGGVPKDSNNHRIRGDINVLLLGDPGTAKSQFLKSVEKTFHRSVYTTGKGASAVGLTASVRKDPQTGEWTLEGGALVLADKGICLIDEFDKMNDHDRTSIHEAMEQQTISISKAGIVANLQARCSVIAAANPIGGRYNSQLSFMDNVDLTEPILSRFDILCVVKDEVSQNLDQKLATFVLNSHMKNHGYNKKLQKENPEELDSLLPLLDQSEDENYKLEKMPQDLLRKYIMHARVKCNPKLTSIDNEKISKFFGELREQSEICGGMKITLRHFESIIRMSEAHAKMHLRSIVTMEDFDMAIGVMLKSFIKSQKHVTAMQLQKKFGSYIIKKEDTNYLLYKILEKIMRSHFSLYQNINRMQISEIKIGYQQFEDEAKDLKINQHQIMNFYSSPIFERYFRRNGDVLVMNTENLRI